MIFFWHQNFSCRSSPKVNFFKFLCYKIILPLELVLFFRRVFFDINLLVAHTLLECNTKKKKQKKYIDEGVA